MTEEQLIQRLQRAGQAELDSPSFELVDEAASLLDRLDQNEQLLKEEWKRLSKLAMGNRIIGDELADTLEKREKLGSLRSVVFRFRPYMAAAAVLVFCLSIGIVYNTWSQRQSHLPGIGGWAFTDFEVLGAKGSIQPVESSNYEEAFGDLREDVTGVTDRSLLERATRAALTNGRLDDADLFAERWREVSPDDARVLNAFGLLALTGDAPDPAKAVQLLDQASDLDPKNPDVLVNRIVALAMLSTSADSIRSQLTKLKEIAPTHRAIPALERWLKSYLE